VRAAAEAGCSVKVLIVREGSTTEPLDTIHVWTPHVRQLTPTAIRAGGIDVL
jgi:hypothetical protein